MARPRLTGGSARGRALVTVPDGARPTSARVREALFSMVGHDLTGQRVLDAFGGSGLLGLEAWSRGAVVVITERDRGAVGAIRRNAEAVGATVEVVPGDVVAKIGTLGRFDVVLADPPYALDPTPILSRLAPAVGRCAVVETAAEGPPPTPVGLVLARRRCYGGTALCVFVPEEAA